MCLTTQKEREKSFLSARPLSTTRRAVGIGRVEYSNERREWRMRMLADLAVQTGYRFSFVSGKEGGDRFLSPPPPKNVHEFKI